MTKRANSQYYLGVDVGATKTAAMIADETGQVLGYSKAGPGNYENVGWPGFKAAVQTVTSQSLGQAGLTMQQISAAGLGIAGYDWPFQRSLHLEALAEIGFGMPLEIVNDAVIALLAGASEGWGVAVIAGTSNNCRGRDRAGREGRITGNGSAFGEYGGGIELVSRAIKMVNYEWIRRGPPTAISTAFLALTGAKDIAEFNEGIVWGRYEPGANWAVNVFEVAYAGDPVAQEVVGWAGCELGELACAVIRQLGMENEAVEVIQSGSLYNGGELLTGPMRQTVQKVAPQARMVRLDYPPVTGAVLLGMEQGLGKEAYARRLGVLESAHHFVEQLQDAPAREDGGLE